MDPPLQLSAISGSPILRLASIRVEGTKDLRTGFLLGICRPYVDPTAASSPWAGALYAHRLHLTKPSQATNLQGIINLTQSIAADLGSYDLFKDVSAKLVPSENPLTSPEEDVDIVIQCLKKSRVFLKTSTDVGNGEGTASVQGRCRNVFGGAETLEGAATFGTRTKQAFNVSSIR